jgi:hypothetical protein
MRGSDASRHDKLKQMTGMASTPIDFGDWPGRIVFGRAVAQLDAVVGRAGGRALVICGRRSRRHSASVCVS